MSNIRIPPDPPLATYPGGWSLYRAPLALTSSFLWPEFKLINSGVRRWGFNRVYRLCWSPLDCRFRRDRQGKQLREAEPELYARVGLWLELERDRGWLLDRFTIEEVEAEQLRITSPR